MSGEPGQDGDGGARGDTSASRHSTTLTHVDVIGTTSAAPSHNSPLRWVLLISLVLLVAIGGAYLASLWTAPLQTTFERRAKPQPPAPAPPEKPVRRPSTESSGVDARVSTFDVATVLRLLPKADPVAGARLFKVCAPCHTDDRNGSHTVGNNLWNIVGGPKAARSDYRYSQALKSKGGTWTYRELAEYLNNPRTSVPGTSMAFFGIVDNERMANLLAYLRTRADRPVPLPN